MACVVQCQCHISVIIVVMWTSVLLICRIYLRLRTLLSVRNDSNLVVIFEVFSLIAFI